LAAQSRTQANITPYKLQKGEAAVLLAKDSRHFNRNTQRVLQGEYTMPTHALSRCCPKFIRERDGSMKSILEELYMGNIGFDSGWHSQNSPFVNAAKRKLDNMEKLEASLNDSQKELFEKFCEGQGDIEGIRHYNVFTAALKFGVLFMMEIIATEQTKH